MVGAVAEVWWVGGRKGAQAHSKIPEQVVSLTQ